jgi:hypothetical protein
VCVYGFACVLQTSLCCVCVSGLALESNFIFAELTDTQKDDFVDAMQEQIVPAGSNIITQGAAALIRLVHTNMPTSAHARRCVYACVPSKDERFDL